jgi:two-component system autoinducer 1 sensor kinase/phosphatase LuxN
LVNEIKDVGRILLFESFVHHLAYPKALLLLSISFFLLGWLIYFISCSLRQSWYLLKALYYPYVIYTFFIMLWIGCNVYFYSGWLVDFGEVEAIGVAKVANIFSFLAFSSAFHFSCRLKSSYDFYKIKRWQSILILCTTIYAFYVNIAPNLTVSGVSINAPGDFEIHFGSQTTLFFSIVILLAILSLFNFLSLSRKANNQLQRLKSTYMAIGIIVFMTSTACLHVFTTIIFQNFSLTWLPPSLSVTELLLMGYAVLCHRFYSWRYLWYITITTAITAIIYLIPLRLLVYQFPQNFIMVGAIWCVFCGVSWQGIWQFIGQYVSLLIYQDKQVPTQKILNLVDDFQVSTQQALHKLACLLDIEQEQALLISDIQSNKLYVNYLDQKHSALLIEEVEQQVSHTSNQKLSLIRDHMAKNKSAVIIPLYDEQDAISQLFISSPKKDGSLYANEEIHALQQLLKQSQSHIHYQNQIHQSQAMAKSIAHEMRNPLAQLQLHLEKLDELVLNYGSIRQIRAEIQQGKDAVQHGSKLIDIILHEVNQSMISEEKLAIFSIKQLLTEAIHDFAYASEVDTTRIQLKTQIDFQVCVNETLFDFVIFNLLRNALYYFDSYPDSVVELTLEAGESYNQLRFIDYGPGIEPQVVQRIFDDFFTFRKPGGSGLGLSYCRRAMALFNGQIECRSVYGQYTEFTLSFPVVAVSAAPEVLIQAQEKSHVSQLSPATDTATEIPQAISVLVTDDNPAQRTLVKLYLEQLNFCVYEAANGLEAIDRVNQHRIDLVLMDVQMPVMGGLEACAAIKKIHPALPVIALSGESGEYEVAQIQQTMDDRLVKPTTKQLLEKMIRDWTDKTETGSSRNSNNVFCK